MNFEQEVRQAIAELNSTQLTHLNRQLATEAMLEALLDRIDPKALPGIAEEYDAALIRLAEGLPPDMQRPEVWKQWSNLLSDRQRYERQKAAQRGTPGAD
jgi:hypothetical protein